MNPEETINLYRQGKRAWNEWADSILRQQPNQNPLTSDQSKIKTERDKLQNDWEQRASASFADHAFESNVDFTGWTFPGRAIFTRVKFNGTVDFRNTSFNQLSFHDTQFEAEASFSGLKADALTFSGATTFGSKVDFSAIQLEEKFSAQGTSFLEATNWDDILFPSPPDLLNATFLHEVDLSATNLEGPILAAGAKFFGLLNLSGKDLQRGNFNGTILHRADFTNTNLVAANFEGADLTGANLLGAHTNTKTRFSEAVVDGCMVNRYALECLENYGGLSKGAMMKMAIQDDVAVLRQNYSGYLRVLHLIALLTFLFPYAWFLVSQWGQAAFDARYLDNADADHITLFEALCRYIYNGGVHWQEGFSFSLSFIAFLLAAAFNILRAVMLWKTKTLEFREEVRGFPVEFSLVEPIYAHKRLEWLTWGALQWVTNKALALYLIIVALNAFHFLSMDIAV